VTNAAAGATGVTGEGAGADSDGPAGARLRGGRAGVGTDGDGKARVDRELKLALAALGTVGDACPLVRRELVMLLGMLIRRFEESVVQVAVRAGCSRDAAGRVIAGAGGGGPSLASIPLFFEEADSDWLPLYVSVRGEEVGFEMGWGGGRHNSNLRSEHSSPSSSTMPIPSSRRSPAKLPRIRSLIDEGEDSDHSPFPTEVCNCIVATLMRLSRDPVADIATHAGLLLQVTPRPCSLSLPLSLVHCHLRQQHPVAQRVSIQCWP
jgi:hypothetical protein